MTKRTMDAILILIGIAVLIFTVAMIWVFLITGAIPDTLCTCFFVACTGECGFMGWIKTAKTKWQDREWTLEDEKRFEEKMKQQQEGKNGSV